MLAESLLLQCLEAKVNSAAHAQNLVHLFTNLYCSIREKDKDKDKTKTKIRSLYSETRRKPSILALPFPAYPPLLYVNENIISYDNLCPTGTELLEITMTKKE